MTGARPSSWIDPFAGEGWPPTVQGCVTTREGAPGLGFDLGGVSAPAAIAALRAELPVRLGVERVQFLRQVHGTAVFEPASEVAPQAPEADAAVTRAPRVALAILTADCLPVLFADRAGTCVAAAHAGWRGLAAGVLEATLAAMARPPGEIVAWLGPGIGQGAFEVGPEVREAVLEASSSCAARADLAAHFTAGRDDRWHLDLAGVAATRLAAAGVAGVWNSGIDSWADAARFYSYRREAGITGRQATLVWLSPPRRS